MIVLMIGVKCGQCTGRWIFKTSWDILLNSVCTSLMRASVISCCTSDWAMRSDIISLVELSRVHSSKTSGCGVLVGQGIDDNCELITIFHHVNGDLMLG